MREPQAAPAPPQPQADASLGDNVPDWLRIADEQAPVVASTTITPPPEDIPEWLKQPDAPVPLLELEDVAIEPATTSPGEVPDWLRDVDEHAQASVQATTGISPAETSASDIPDWLRGASEAPPPAPSTPAESDDVPPWLRDEQPATPATGFAPPAPPSGGAASSEADDIPAWLRDDATPAPTVRLEDTAPPADDVPPWLRDDAAPAAPAPTVRLEDAPAPAGDIPAWLQDDAAPAQTTANAVPAWLQDDTPTAPAAPSGVPAWLQDEALDAPAPTVRLDDTQESPSDIPSWLVEDVPAVASPTVQLSPQATARLEPAPTRPSDSATPSWLLDDEPTLPGAPAATDDSMLGSVDLPAWLRQSMTPVEPVEPEVVEPAESPDWLRTLGLPDPTVAPSEPAAVARRFEIAPPTAIERSPERVAAVEMLRDLVLNPVPAPLPAPEAVPLRWWQKIGIERISAIVILLAILIGLLVPNLPFNTSSAVNTKAIDLHNYIESMTPNSRIMIVYASNLRHSAEIAPLEAAVVGQIVGKTIPTVLLATDPDGSLIKDQRIALMRQAYGEEAEGKFYLNLGFIAGGDGVLQRRFADNARSAIADELKRLNPANNVDFLGVMSRVSSTNQYDSPIINDMSNFDLLIIVADDQKDVQPWVEQVWSKYTALPVAVLATNETAPLIQPFINVEGDFYTVVGMSGAQAYGAMNGTPGSAATINALSLSSIAVALLIIGGGAASFGRRSRQRRKN
ncbi:MAG TPA: hypothetical protein VD886_25725 [Herpetosiphonaceae bacterium]|nr:hypothetical protein [Herpetosiphonaceae bacterium]